MYRLEAETALLEAMASVADGNESALFAARLEALKIKVIDDWLFRLNGMKNGSELLYDPKPEQKP